VCRRTAEREYRQTVRRLAHFQSVVDLLRVDVAAFDKAVSVDDDQPAVVTEEQRQVAHDAVTRAGGAVTFLRQSDEQAAVEFCALYDAVAPVLL
jgi:hypothetical protein